MKKAISIPIWYAFAALVLAACNGQNGELEVTGQIEGVTVAPGSRVGGRVEEVLVAEGDRVSTGDVLVRLERGESQAAVAAAQAQLNQCEATLKKLKKGARAEEIEQARAAVTQAEAQYNMALEGARSQEINAARANAESVRARLEEAKKEFDRASQLIKEKAVPERVYDQARSAVDALTSQYEAAREQLNLLVAGTRDEQIAQAKAAYDQAKAALELLRNGAREEDIAAAKAQCQAAEAQLARAKVSLEEMTIRAPMKGVIESIDVRPGDLVQPGPFVEIADPDNLELVVYVGALYLGKLRVNQDVEITTDSHGDERFRGTIIHIASQGEFTPRNLQTEEERVQQVFGVRLALDSHDGKLRAGMAATVHFDVTNPPEEVDS